MKIITAKKAAAPMDDMGNTELNYCYNCMTRLDSGQTVCPICGHDNSRLENPGSTLPEGTILAGKYLVGKVLGQGGFGITYLGFDTALDVKVAIKEYFPAGIGLRSSGSIRVTPVTFQGKAEAFRKGCEEFQSEARHLAGIDSPNIVKVRDYFRENGTAYIVMNYLEGNNLTKELESCGGKMTWQRVTELFRPLIVELEKLHEGQLIHRDIKPDNIKVVREKNGRERLVLLDFGAARSFVSAEVTGTYTAMLTPGYAPVEQYSRKARQGPFTDIYAICATMWMAVTGKRPAEANDRILGLTDVSSLSESGIDVPENVDKAIMHGLAVRSEDRTRTMRELYKELYEEEPPLDPLPEKPVPAERPAEKTVKETPRNPEPKRDPKKWLFILLIAALIGAGAFFALNIKRDRTSFQHTQTAFYLLQAGMAGSITPLPPTDTPEPSVTNTAVPTSTDTPEPTATNTAVPTSTNTPEPTATNTAVPTSTDAPESTATEIPVPVIIPTEAAAVKAGDIITLGRYEQDGDLTNGAEAIEWQVLAAEDGRALVISRYGLDAKPYNEERTSVTWETSTLRTWLNGEFYNRAFSSEEKGRIREVRVKNPDNPGYGTKGGNDTTDKIILLSIEEANRYFVNDEERKCWPTTYAKNNGAYVNEDRGGTTVWWLRSSGFTDFDAVYVNLNGLVNDISIFVNYDSIAVRPAFWLDLSSEMGLIVSTETDVPAAVEKPVVTNTPEQTAEPTKPSLSVGNIITLGRYEQDGDLNNGAEAIEWQVLAVEDGRALVISRYGLDAKPYNEERTSVTWETCTLRSWLNGEFYDSAFSSEEKGRIRQVTVKNPDKYEYGTKGGNETTDRIFLLSIVEAEQYFEDDEARMCRPTTYAKNNGAWVWGGTTWWWLRSPGLSDRSAADVNTDGHVYDYGLGVGDTSSSARPAFWLNL